MPAPHSQTGAGEVGSGEMALRLSFASLGLACSQGGQNV